MKKWLFVLILSMPWALASAQNAPGIHLEATTIEGMPGLQSFAFAQHNGWWFLFGGRVDGLHRRQPFASFDAAGHNRNIYAINPATNQSYFVSVDGLETNLAEHLSTTNTEYVQNGNLFYLIGGYGISTQANDHQTFPYVTEINLDLLLFQMQNDVQLTSEPFRMIESQQMAITGGSAHYYNGHYYLVGGHRFDGRYNPMNGPSFVQTYHTGIIIFDIVSNANSFELLIDSTITDAAHLRRRDYNLVPQILPSGEEVLTIYSGVFREDADLPFLYPVDITETGHTAYTERKQYLNHYHCGTVGTYSASAESMYTFFLGGMAQYYPGPSGTLIEDQSVPFVTSIGRIARTPENPWQEVVMPLEMPGYLGGSAEFIPLPDLPMLTNEVIDWDNLQGDTILVGYLVGGIESSSPNIFFVNTGNESDAVSTVHRVYLTRNDGLPQTVQNMPVLIRNDLFVTITPIPSVDHVNLTVNITEPGELIVYANDASGKEIVRENFSIQETGDYDIRLTLPEQTSGFIHIYANCGHHTGYAKTVVIKK
jgi:hypothetical protein